MKKLLVILAIVTALLGVNASPAMAATEDSVTVTATPDYVAGSLDVTTWLLNGITGSGKVVPNTVYYSNPLGDTTAPSATVLDAECRFTWQNESTVATNVYANCSDFAGGSADMENSNDGSNGAGTYGAYAWYSGMTYSAKVVMKATGSSVLISALPATTDKKLGAEIETQTAAWAGGTASTATLTVSTVAS